MQQTEFITFIITAFVIVTIFLIRIVVFFLQMRSAKKLQQQNEQIMVETFNRQLAEQTLLTQQHTMEEIGKELHDNVAQQLVLISMAAYAKKIDNVKITTLVNDCIEEIRQLSKSLTDHKTQTLHLYELISREKEKIESYTSFKINVDFNNENVVVNKAIHKISIFRVVQEFIQNSLKHSGGNAIYINCTANDCIYNFELYDNGKGYDETKDLEAGIGLKNIQKRLSKFASKIAINKKQNFGASLSFTVLNEPNEK
jgi:signal transduction histidine kinase